MAYIGPNPITVPDGGTNASSFIPFTPICGGTTSTSALMSVTSIGSTGQVLTSNGPGVLPSYQAQGTFPWVVVAGTAQAMSVNTGYTSNNAGLVTLTMPPTASVGDTLVVTGLGAGGWTIAQNAGQLINVGSNATTTGIAGSISSTNAFDSITFTCVVANTTWVTRSEVGNLTLV
jgi:hypothetical protein